MSTNPFQSPTPRFGEAPPAMICQSCGVEAPTRYVSFWQNIGALFVRFHKSMQGNLCKNCIHKHFWSMTGTTLALGWWGTISFIITPFLLLNNIGRYAMCLGMPAVPPGATLPVLSDESVERIGPHARWIFDRLNGGEKFEQVMLSTAQAANVAPAQVILFVRAVIEAQQAK